MKSKLKFLLFWVLIALGSNRGLAQTITFSESFLTNETPPATYQGSTRVLYACAWQYAVLVNVSTPEHAAPLLKHCQQEWILIL
ncbi:MAG: hypothetical protein IPG39_18195 [Bacteroidetes bacterium]|nr:hypothetical protein [Bacteroidota bacterium]